MFENFVIFTEIVKLSSNIFWRMRKVNYHDKLLDLIYNKQDVVTFEEVIDLVEDKWLITKFIDIFEICEKHDEKKWLENIFKAINDVDITAFDILLVHSSKNGFIDFVKYLLEKGANIHAKDDGALRWAASNGHLEVVKYLVERPDCKVCRQRCCHGANIHALENCTLKWAAENGHLEVVKYLVENGANIHDRDDISLRWAAKYGHLEVVNYLKMKME